MRPSRRSEPPAVPSRRGSYGSRLALVKRLECARTRSTSPITAAITATGSRGERQSKPSRRWLDWYHPGPRVSSIRDNQSRPRVELMIRIDSRADEGLQRQVHGAVRRAILDGVLQPGARLPSSRALAEDLRVSRTTTLLAYEQLIAEGYLETRRASGTFVADELPDDLPRRWAPPRPSRTKHPRVSRRGVLLAA